MLAARVQPHWAACMTVNSVSPSEFPSAMSGSVLLASLVMTTHSGQPWILFCRRMSELLWNVCVGHSLNPCNQWFKSIIGQERQSDAAADGFLPLFFSMSHFYFLSVFFSLHPSHSHPSPIFSGSSDHPPSLGSERLCSKLPPLRPDSQARKQVPRQICRWARNQVDVSSQWSLKVCVCFIWK